MGDPRNNSSRRTRASPRKLKKQEVGLGSRQGAQGLGGPLPGPDPRGEAPGPGRDSPASAFRSSRGPGPEAQGAEAAGASEAQPEGPAQGRGPGARAVLAASAYTAAAATLWSIPARVSPGAARSRRAATPDQQPQRAGSGERPA